MSKLPQKRRSAPRFSPYFIKRLSSWLVLSTALTIAVRSASNLYWDSDGNATGNTVEGANLGGSGTWNTGSNTWWDGDAGATSDTAWNNLDPATAVFTGTAGTVTLGQPTNAAGLTFNTTGYTLAGTGGNTLTLVGTAEVKVTNPADTAIITAVMGGSAGLLKTGAGLLRLGAANTYSGVTHVAGGGIILAANSSTTAPTTVLTSGPLGQVLWFSTAELRCWSTMSIAQL